YVCAVEYLDRAAARDPAPTALRRGARAIASITAVVALSLSATPSPFFAGVFLFALLARGVPLFAPLWSGAGAAAIRDSTRGALILAPLLDATFVAAAARPLSALVVASMMLPALALGRQNGA